MEIADKGATGDEPLVWYRSAFTLGMDAMKNARTAWVELNGAAHRPSYSVMPIDTGPWGPGSHGCVGPSWRDPGKIMDDFARVFILELLNFGR